MLEKVKVTPLAAESLGARSMCTLVETPEIAILLDAGISLAPNRFALPPHPIEFRTIAKLRKRIAEAAEKAHVVTISHYHFDHHTPSFEDWLVNWTEERETARQIYQNKRVLMKNPREKINPNQRHRAWLFQKTGGKNAKSLEKADGRAFALGKNTVLRFSEPVAHGSEDARLGWVIMAEVEYKGEKFMFSPDVQGPMSTQTLELIRAAKPATLMLGGPPFYLSGFKIDEVQLQKATSNLLHVVANVPVTILEHHTLRDGHGQQWLKQVRQVACKAGHEVVTSAEYAGEEDVFLESRRKELFVEDPPSAEYRRWMNAAPDQKARLKPPV